MDNQSVNEAIEILINNFTRHPGLSQSTTGSKMNVFAMLQEFWQMKYNQSQNVDHNDPLGQQISDVNIVYEFLEKPGPPYVCFVTLPGGACFATFQV